MNESDALLIKAREGFGTLTVSEKYIESALNWIEIWLTDEAFKDYVPLIKHLIESEKWGLLLDSFYQVIQRSTSCYRVPCSITPNCITTKDTKSSNNWDSQHLIMQFPEKDIQG